MSPRSYYSEVNDDPLLAKIHEDFKTLNPEYGIIPLRIGDSAYTQDKSVITICKKHPKTGKIYEYCCYLYVALHELTHMVTESYGHDARFQRNFKIILQAAVDKGIYDPTCKIPPDYCGIDT